MTCPNCGSGQIVLGLKRAPRRGKIIDEIFRLLQLAGPQGLTAEDVEALTHLGHQTVSARIHDLELRGVIEAAEQRPTKRSGRPAWAWRAISAEAAEAAR